MATSVVNKREPVFVLDEVLSGAADKPKVKRRRRRKANPLAPVVREARRQRREMNKYLSEAISGVLGFGVTVKVNMDVSLSPDMERALKKGSRQYKRMFATVFNAP